MIYILSSLTLYINLNAIIFKYKLGEDEEKEKIFQILLDDYVIEKTEIMLDH